MPSSAQNGYVYDPTTGTWKPPSSPTPSAPSSGSTPTADPTEAEKVPSTVTGNTGSQVDSKTKAEKKYIEVEFNTLEGELVVSPSKKTLKVKVNDTVNIQGIGSYLSGKYFVSAVKRTLNSDSGYSHTLTVIKNGFGDSLKKAKTDSEVDREDTVSKTAPEIKVNDKVQIVGDAVYTNAHNGVPVPAWVKEKILTVSQVSDDGSRVLLMPIKSWTYTRFVQKV